MKAPSLSADSHIIVLLCSSLATQGDTRLKPLPPTEWHTLSLALRKADLRPRDLSGLASSALREAIEIDAELADRVAALLARGGQLALEIERLGNIGIWIVTRADEGYPPLLKQRLGRTAPPVLFGAGPQAGLQLDGIAVAGSRDVADDGLEFAASLGSCCAAQRYALVSGAARGVDATSMKGALARGGATVGITVEPLERLVRRRELRTAIADELLTLATPFHPGARWHAGNAMRRNRLIYALSQAAIVVASSPEKGGTRAGALENLKAGWVPLYVRDDGSPGNTNLIGAGGLPLPPDDPAEWIEVDRLREGQRSPSATSPPGPQSSAGGELPGYDPREAMDDAFVAVWPILERHLREPLGEREVAERMKLQVTQARSWLKHAVAEGRATMKQRPKRYFVPEDNDAQLRIEEPKSS